ncbi:10353_t:CDS:2, partial [Diversispora eburnea]
ADILIQAHLKIEYLDFAAIMAFRNNSPIVAIIRSSPNLKCFNISGNDIGDEVVEAVANTCHELEYLDLGGCGFITEPSIYNVVRFCSKLQHLELGFCDISDTTVKKIARSCSNLKHLDLDSYKNIKNYNSSNELSDSKFNSATSNDDTSDSDDNTLDSDNNTSDSDDDTSDSDDDILNSDPNVDSQSEDPPPLIPTFTDILDENRFISEFINHITLNSDTEFPAL